MQQNYKQGLTYMYIYCIFQILQINGVPNNSNVVLEEDGRVALTEAEQELALQVMEQQQRIQKDNLIQLKANLVKGILGAHGYEPDEEALKKLEERIRERRKEAKYEEELIQAEQKLEREKKEMEELKQHMEKVKQKKAST